MQKSIIASKYWILPKLKYKDLAFKSSENSHSVNLYNKVFGKLTKKNSKEELIYLKDIK